MTLPFVEPPFATSQSVGHQGGLAKAVEWPTVGLFVFALGLWAGALMMPGNWAILAVLTLAVVLALHSSLSHEILHGHPVRSPWGQTALGLFQPGLFVPYLRFKALHLAHHRDAHLTDPYEDPESHFFDPDVWARMPLWQRAMLEANNTLAGRMVIGPALGMTQFLWDDWRRIRAGQWAVAGHWLAHVPGAVLTLWLVGQSALPVWAYLLACYGAMSILRIRTFLEHQAHERTTGRSVIIEDRGLLALLFLNNNFHFVHHLHPGVAWYDLPRVYREKRESYLRANEGYVFPSYASVFRRFFWRRKDPVAHPLWQRSEE